MILRMLCLWLVVQTWTAAAAVELPADNPDDATLPAAAKVSSRNSDGHGTVILHAVDLKTGKPIPDVEFMMCNDTAEDWYRPLGKTDKKGVYSFGSKPMPGYFITVWRKPKTYQLASIDDVASNIRVGQTVEHFFRFRKLPKDNRLPKIRKVPKDWASPFRDASDTYEFTNMPGFKGRKVLFLCKRTKENIRFAERIYYNGRRILALVRDELTHFQKAEPHDRGDIKAMKDIVIEIVNSVDPKKQATWRLWCRVPGGLPLRQRGYPIWFRDVERADLQIPDYVQPSNQ